MNRADWKRKSSMTHLIQMIAFHSRGFSSSYSFAERHFPELSIKVLDQKTSKLIPYVNIAITCGGSGSHMGCTQGCDKNKDDQFI